MEGFFMGGSYGEGVWSLVGGWIWSVRDGREEAT